MDKKELKWYVAPAVEIIETELEGQLLAGSGMTPHVGDESEDQDLGELGA